MAKIRPNNLKSRMETRNPKPRRAPEEGEMRPQVDPQADDEKKRGPKPKIEHPLLADGKLEAIPDDFDPKVHKPLRKKDFVEEAVFFDHKAEQAEERLNYYREQAEECRKLGNAADRKKAKKLRTWMEKIAELKAELEEDGVDVSSLIDTDIFNE